MARPDAELERVLKLSMEEAKREEQRRKQLHHVEEDHFAAAIRASLQETNKADTYACGRCTFVNNNKNANCEVCGFAKPKPAVHVPAPAPAPAPMIIASPAPAPIAIAVQQPQQPQFRTISSVPVVKGNLNVQVKRGVKLPTTEHFSPFVDMRVMEMAPKGAFRLMVCEAKNLYDTAMIGTQEPYCTVTIGGVTHKTKVVLSGGTNCTFLDTVNFDLSGNANEENIIIEVLAKGTISDEHIGRMVIPVKDVLMQTVNAPAFFPLTRYQTTQAAGTLSLQVAADPNRQMIQRELKSCNMKTKEAKDGQAGNPTWNQEFALKNVYSDIFLWFGVFDVQGYSKSLVGQTPIMSLQDLILQIHYSNGQKTLFPLGIPSNPNVGQIELIFQFTNSDHPYGLRPVETVVPIPQSAQMPVAIAAPNNLPAYAAIPAPAAGGMYPVLQRPPATNPQLQPQAQADIPPPAYL